MQRAWALLMGSAKYQFVKPAGDAATRFLFVSSYASSEKLCTQQLQLAFSSFGACEVVPAKDGRTHAYVVYQEHHAAAAAKEALTASGSDNPIGRNLCIKYTELKKPKVVSGFPLVGQQARRLAPPRSCAQGDAASILHKH